MTAKYIDLKPQVVSDYALVGATAVQGGVGIALEWLDRHPDQVPGRTITESEFHETADANRNGGLGWEDLADRLGITVVPDPEPTNAELIDEAYEVWDRDPQDFTFGEYLVRLGWTKAPGGDDER